MSTEHQRKTQKLYDEGRTPIQYWILAKHKKKLDLLAKKEARSRQAQFRYMVEKFLESLP